MSFSIDFELRDGAHIVEKGTIVEHTIERMAQRCAIYRNSVRKGADLTFSDVYTTPIIVMGVEQLEDLISA